MPRHPARGDAARSQRWIQVATNDAGTLLSERVAEAFGWSPGDLTITWVSPRRGDDYAEYSDADFLRVLELSKHTERLADYWPDGGPHWDALGRTQGGRVVLVEAKAYIAELLSGGSNAGVRSLDRIHRAMIETRINLDVGNENDWDGAFFQAANRLAHLRFLREVCEEDAYLVYVCFVNAPDVPRSAGEDEWRGALELVDAYLGTTHHRLKRFKAAVFIDPLKDMHV
jgi:hypothetical protein